MGSWGHGPMQADAALDVHGAFRQMIDDGHDPGVAGSVLRQEWLPQFEESGEVIEFWAGLAKALWDYGSLDADTLREVKERLRTPQALEGCHPDDHPTRRAAIERFLRSLETPRKRPLKKRMTRAERRILDPGACLALRLPGGDFGAAVLTQVVEVERGRLMYRLVALHGRFLDSPTMEVFHRRHWLIADNADLRAESELMARRFPAVYPFPHPDREVHVWCRSGDLRTTAADYSAVGSIDIAADDPILADITEPGQFCSGVAALAGVIASQGTPRARFRPLADTARETPSDD